MMPVAVDGIQLFHYICIKVVKIRHVVLSLYLQTAVFLALNYSLQTSKREFLLKKTAV